MTDDADDGTPTELALWAAEIEAYLAGLPPVGDEPGFDAPIGGTVFG